MASSRSLLGRLGAVNKQAERTIGDRGHVDVTKPSRWLELEILRAPKFIKLNGERVVNLDLDSSLGDFTEQMKAFLGRRGCTATDENISQLWHLMSKSAKQIEAEFPGLD